MNFCTKCGCQRTQGWKFCPKCGNAFDRGQQLPPYPSPNYTGYYQQPYQQPGYQKPAEIPCAEKPSRSLYDKLYRSFGGGIFITLLGICLLFPFLSISITYYMDEIGTAPAVLIGLSPLVWYPLVIFTPVMVVHSKLSKSSLRKARVVLRNKGQFETYIPRSGVAIRQSFTFEFPDGSTESLFLRSKHIRASGMYDLSVAGDSGTLVYQELNSKMRLVDFENDNFTVNSKRSLYDKIHHTQGGYLFSVLTLTFSSIALLIGIMLTLGAFLDESFNVNPYIFMMLLVFLPAALIGFICIPRLYVGLKLKGNPKEQLQVKEKQMRVKLIDKGNFGKHANDITRRVLVFELPDKARKSFHIRDSDIYNLALVNDTGILTYKERKDNAIFVNFERDK